MLRSIVALGLLLSLATPIAAQPTVPVTTCGQAIPAETIGILAADLDCSAYAGGDYGVVVGKRGTLDRAGFTLTGGYTGVGCVGPCPDGNGLCFLQCSIRNGTIEGADYSGVSGDKVTIENVTIRNIEGRGIAGGRRVKVFASIINDNGVAGVIGRALYVEASTITGNGRAGVNTANGRVRVKDSTIIGNDTSPECTPPTSGPCFDIGSSRRPRVANTTCGKSYNPSGVQLGDCNGWCVCAGDQP